MKLITHQKNKVRSKLANNVTDTLVNSALFDGSFERLYSPFKLGHSRKSDLELYEYRCDYYSAALARVNVQGGKHSRAKHFTRKDPLSRDDVIHHVIYAEFQSDSRADVFQLFKPTTNEFPV
jgi:hypothetical protein